MFIYNFKLDHKLILKIAIILMFVAVIFIVGISVFKMFNNQKVNDDIPIPEVSNITSENYTNILKSVHDNLDEHIGQKIHFIGYVYRVYDFSDTQFVLARNMVVSSNNQSLVVGFLCDYKNAKQFNDGCWVEITGKITKGDYHGEIPVIEVQEIKACDKPQDETVLPPNDMYIPTSALF